MPYHLLALVAVMTAALAPVSVANDEPDELIRGKRISIRTNQVLSFLARTATFFDAPNLANDPTVEGGVLEVFDTDGTAGSVAYVLPAAQWEVVGRDPGNKGWRYRGAGTLADPCRLVRATRKVVRAVCRDMVPLNPPFTGDAGIVLTVGTNSKRYCARMGGRTIRNESGRLLRRGSDAPVACPTPPSSPGGAFVDLGAMPF